MKCCFINLNATAFVVKSYLENRKHFVQFGNTKSYEVTIRCGVPQGSILGPLLFTLYINDIPNSLCSAEPILFVDDKSIYYSQSDLRVLAEVMDDTLQSVGQWCGQISCVLTRIRLILLFSNFGKRW